MILEIERDLETNAIRELGLEHGSKPRFVADNPSEKLLVILRPGRAYFGGVGQSRPYSPMRFIVMHYDTERRCDSKVIYGYRHGVNGVLNFSPRGHNG